MARPKKYNISLTDDELKELKSVNEILYFFGLAI